MTNPNLSILLVNHDSACGEPIGQRLQQAGFLDVRQARSNEALAQIEQQPASLLLLCGSDALRLATQVRQLDGAAGLYTYMILLSDQPAEDLLDESAGNAIDEVIDPAHLEQHLLPRIFAADRLCSTLQRLHQENRLMRENLAGLEQRNLIDALTGLGNAHYLRQKLSDSLLQVEARGGALCYLLIGLENATVMQREHGSDFYNKLLQDVAHRLQQMVRPLDVLVRLDDQHFVLLILTPNLQECTPASFKRLHEGLNRKAFKTSAGLIDISAGISLVQLDSKGLPIDPQILFDEASQLLTDSYASSLISATRLPDKA